MNLPLHAAPGAARALLRRASGVLPGLALAAAVAVAALALARMEWLAARGVSVLTVAIVLGMLVGNTFYARIGAICGPGVTLSRQQLLRAGVVLYGLRLTLQDVATVGFGGVLIDVLVLGSTFALACFAGTRWLGLDRRTAVLIGAGSAICGAAAVMATEPVARARTEQVTVAIATVVVFGTLAVFLYPALFALNQRWPFIPGGTHGFGVYVGSTVHEVAQVVAVGRSVAPDAADTAVIAKMVRVMMLAPFLLLLAAWLARDDASSPSADKRSARGPGLPLFPLAFVALVVLNSFQWLAPGVRELGIEIGNGLLAIAMAALGIATHASALRRAGARPLLLGGLLFAWLVLGGGLINRALPLLITPS